MNRRSFLSGLAAIVGGIALDQAVPFGRVYSFPKEIKSLNLYSPTVAQVIALMHERIRPKLASFLQDDDLLWGKLEIENLRQFNVPTYCGNYGIVSRSAFPGKP